jgi:hypothetical protein
LFYWGILGTQQQIIKPTNRPDIQPIKSYDQHGTMRKEVAMGDRKIKVPTHAIEQITPETKSCFKPSKEQAQRQKYKGLKYQI